MIIEKDLAAGLQKVRDMTAGVTSLVDSALAEARKAPPDTEKVLKDLRWVLVTLSSQQRQIEALLPPLRMDAARKEGILIATTTEFDECVNEWEARLDAADEGK